MLDRRAFIGTLLASIAGTAISPASILWRPSPEAAAVVDPKALLSLHQLTVEFARRLSQHVNGQIVDGSLLGQTGLRDQFSIQMGFPAEVDRYGIDSDRYIKPAVDLMARKLQLSRATRFGQLPLLANLLPDGCQAALVTGNGVSVRGVRLYDPVDDIDTLRFDVVSG